MIDEDELRTFLKRNGYEFFTDSRPSEHNLVHWCAAKKIEGAAKRCELNDSLQFVINPYFSKHLASAAECEVEIHGQRKGLWHNVSVQGVSPVEMTERLEEIEERLLKLWSHID